MLRDESVLSSRDHRFSLEKPCCLESLVQRHVWLGLTKESTGVLGQRKLEE
jgi:hypothetical protein